MVSSRLRHSLLWAILAIVFVATRLPAATTWSPTAAELHRIGAAQLLLTSDDPRPTALIDAPPAAAVLASIPAVFLVEELDEFDPRGPSTQIGLRAVYEASSSRTGPLSPQASLLLCRLPQLLLGLLAFELLRRLGKRFAGELTGWIAAAAWALHPGLVAAGCLATEEFLAPVAALFFVLSLVDYHDVSGRHGPVAKRRMLRVGIAAGIALLTAYHLIPLLLCGAVFSVLWRRRRRAHAEPRRAAPGRRMLGIILVALLVLLAGHGFRPAALAPLPEESAVFAGMLDWVPLLDADAAGAWVGSLRLPGGSYVRGLLRTCLLAEAPATDPGAVAAALGVKTPLAWLALAALGAIGWFTVRKDRADLPDFLLVLGIVPLVVALWTPPGAAIAATLPSLAFVALLGAAGIERIRQDRTALAATTIVALLLLTALDGVASRGDTVGFVHALAGGRDGAARHLRGPDLYRGQDFWSLLDEADADGTEALHCLADTPPGLIARESIQRPFLRVLPREEELFERLRSVTAVEADSPPTKQAPLLAVADTVWQRAGVRPDRVPTPLRRIGRLSVHPLPRR